MSVLRTLLFAFAVTVLPVALAAGDVPLSVRDSSNAVVQRFALADLDAMPQTRFETSTIWTEDTVTFSGVALSVLIREAGLKGETLHLTALNDYEIDLPVAEIGPDYPVVATRMNGRTMSVRNKGPFWVVYPYDADPAFRTETVYARSIWQLTDLAVATPDN